MSLAPHRRQILRNQQNQSTTSRIPGFHDRWGTISDIIGWVINLIVAACTIALFILTLDSLSLTRIALHEAKTANIISDKNNEEAKRANGISQSNYILAQQQFEAYKSQRVTDSITNAEETKKRDYLDYINSVHQDSIFKAQLQINKSTLNAFEKIALLNEQQFNAEGPKLEFDKVDLIKSLQGYKLYVSLKNSGHRDLAIITGNAVIFNERLDTLKTTSLTKYVELGPGKTESINTDRYIVDSIIKATGTVIVISCSYEDSQFGKEVYYFTEVIGGISFNQSNGTITSYLRFTPVGKNKMMEKVNKKLDSMLKD